MSSDEEAEGGRKLVYIQFELILTVISAREFFNFVLTYETDDTIMIHEKY